MFNAGFVEASIDQFTFEITGDKNLDSVDATSEYTALGAHPEDSDEEDEVYDPGEADGDPPNSDVEPEEVFEIPHELLGSGVSVEVEVLADGDDDGEGQDGKSRNVRQKLAHPSSPRASDAQIIPRGVASVVGKEVLGPPKLRVVVKDVAYATYRAVLYYVCTFSCVPCVPLTIFVSSCIRTVSVSRRCPHPSSRRVLLGRAARKQRTIVRAALVPPVQGRLKYLLVPARGGNGSRIGYAEILDNLYHARQRPCTDLPTVSKTLLSSLCQAVDVVVFLAELGLAELKARAFDVSDLFLFVLPNALCSHSI